MAEIKITIKNIDEIRRAFSLAPALMSKELNRAIRKVLILIQGETIRNVHPERGINVITGGLLSAALRPPEYGNLKGTYRVNIFYAPFVHDGTRFMRPRPFLDNAVDSQQQAVDKSFTQAVDNVLSELGDKK